MHKPVKRITIAREISINEEFERETKKPMIPDSLSENKFCIILRISIKTRNINETKKNNLDKNEVLKSE